MKIKSTFKLLAIAAIALLVSCKKNNSNSDTENPPVKKLKYLTQITTVQGTSTRLTNYTYDDKNRLVSQTIGNSLITYEYNSDGRLSLITTGAGTTISNIKELSYVGGILSSATLRTYIGTSVMTDNYGFVFSGNNLTEVHINGDHGYHVTVYTYDGSNNLVRSSIDLDYSVTVYTYDNKKSRFTNMQQDFRNPFISSADACSANNVISQKTNAGAATNYTFAYDNDGYPTTRTFKMGVDSTKDTFTYTEM